MSYYKIAGSGSDILLGGILILVILLILSLITISKRISNKQIKLYFYIGLFIQIGILLIDNYIMAFPTIDMDTRAFERHGWHSYLLNINEGRGNYNYWVINPIYKLIKIRVALIFGAINIFLHILINLNLYEILKGLNINKKIRKIAMGIGILSPITLITRAGVLREAIIVFLLSLSLKYFIKYCNSNKSKNIGIAIFCVLIATLFHGGVLFISVGYIMVLLKKDQKKGICGKQVGIIIIFIIIFFIFKDRLLLKVGGGNLESIMKSSNSEVLRSAGSSYLRNSQTDNPFVLLAYLPLRIFYFLFSPTPDMFRNIIDIGVFTLNSSIYIFLIIKIYKYRKRIRVSRKEHVIIKNLTISIVFTIAVFSIGTHNAGTAMRHRDKILIFLIIIYGIVKNRYELSKRRKRRNVRKTI